MTNLFHNKKLSVMMVASILLIAVLLLILLVNLSQSAMLKQKIEMLQKTLEDYKSQKITQQEWEEYKKTNEYVIEWAVKNDMIGLDDINWKLDD